jgi:hypothetical protein
MKFRFSLVSNSSSSSFVIVFPHAPMSVVDLQVMLFDANQTVFTNPYGDGGYPVADIAEWVLNNLEPNRPITRNEVIELACNGYIDSIYKQIEREFPDRYDYKLPTEERHEMWDKRDARERELATAYADRFLEAQSSGQIFAIEIADGDGPMGNAMEHGGLFRNLPHFRVSHH